MAKKDLEIDFGEISRNLAAMAARTPEVADELVGQTAQAVVKEAMDRTPVGPTGALKAANAAKWHGGEQAPGTSGHPDAEAPEAFAPEPGPAEAYVYNSMRYAAKVHEDMDAHHDIGEAKYIENALGAVGPEMIERIAKGLMKGLKP